MLNVGLLGPKNIEMTLVLSSNGREFLEYLGNCHVSATVNTPPNARCRETQSPCIMKGLAIRATLVHGP